MRKLLYPLLTIIVVVGLYYAEAYVNKKTEKYPDTTNETVGSSSEEFKGNWLPSHQPNQLVAHTYFTLSYNEAHEQATWVAYPLLKEHLVTNNFKRPYFVEDRSVTTTSADWRNYKNSGYDRGHLCPAGDRRFSYEAYHETFLTSNISPQDNGFNSGIWNKLEQKTRFWAKKYDGVYVVTGPVLKNPLGTIGYEKVTVPSAFFKIIVDNSGKQPKALAFLIPNKATDRSFYEYATTIDTVEKETGIDFFAALDPAIEAKLETSYNLKEWGKR